MNSIIQFFITYGEAIIGITLMLLLITYWVLIWRINKLQNTMANFQKYAKSLEEKVNNMSSNIVNIASSIGKLDILRKGELKINGKTPFGDVDLSIDLGKINAAGAQNEQATTARQLSNTDIQQASTNRP